VWKLSSSEDRGLSLRPGTGPPAAGSVWAVACEEPVSVARVLVPRA
jgi:hypothetical protein